MCCYGAQPYDPKDAGTPYDLHFVYCRRMRRFLGTTNIAFAGIDPSVPFGGADHLVVVSFFKHVLGGASLGVALAEARQDFIKKQMMAEGI